MKERRALNIYTSFGRDVLGSTEMGWGKIIGLWCRHCFSRLFSIGEKGKVDSIVFSLVDQLLKSKWGGLGSKSFQERNGFGSCFATNIFSSVSASSSYKFCLFFFCCLPILFKAWTRQCGSASIKRSLAPASHLLRRAPLSIEYLIKCIFKKVMFKKSAKKKH